MNTLLKLWSLLPKSIVERKSHAPLAIIDLANRQHEELLSKIEGLNKSVQSLKLVPVTLVYLLSVSYFFYAGRLSEYAFIAMVIYPLTPIYGERPIKFVAELFKKR